MLLSSLYGTRFLICRQISIASAKSSEEFTSNGLISASTTNDVQFLPSLAIYKRPLFPLFYKTISINDQTVLSELNTLIKKGKPHLGIFLSKSKDTKFSSGCDLINNTNNIYKVGVISKLINILPSTPLGSTGTAIVFPQKRITFSEFFDDDILSVVKAETLREEPFERSNPVIRALCQEIYSVLADIAKINPFFREHLSHQNLTVDLFEDPAKLADLIAVLCSGEPEELQEILESIVIEERLRKSLILLKKELITAQLQATINRDVEQKLNQRQKEYFLHEQLKAIKKELGIDLDSKEKIIENLKEKGKRKSFPEKVKEIFHEELLKIQSLESSGSEFNVVRNYIEWILALPWNCFKEENYDLEHAEKILNDDHYGLDDVKKRILEFIAVSSLKKTAHGKILCLVGPPGVGKTSIAKSIAKAVNREYIRISIGGLNDVAEIKGHRRTYVGAMPGKIVQQLKRIESMNPLILIDEVDKIGRGHTGDPSAALLELLDPEQNNQFLDFYLDLPIDLSSTLFICTANTTDSIPAPLLDRMEIIDIPGYVNEEKIQILNRYLLPECIQENGIGKTSLELTSDAIDKMVKEYSRENGVRNLKKLVDKICRKIALEKVSKGIKYVLVDSSSLEKYIGKPSYNPERFYTNTLLPPGVVTGLAWTNHGGSLLYVETIAIPKKFDGTNSIVRTGNMGTVMQESAALALSFCKSFLTKNNINSNFFSENILHIHVPEGATPKDGPSAGSTMAVSILSFILNKKISSDLAMTGEISLTGKILKIGGLKEKLIAARRSYIKSLILPVSNKDDWDELPGFLKKDIQVLFVEDFNEIAKTLEMI